jgi:hypothetical protein
MTVLDRDQVDPLVVASIKLLALGHALLDAEDIVT